MDKPCDPIPVSDFFTEDRRFAAVYLLYRNGLIVYVGQSRTLLWRIEQHIAEAVKTFDAVAFVPCQVPQLNTVERRYIRKYAPQYNACSVAKKAKETLAYQPSRKARWSHAKKAQRKAQAA